MMAQCAESGGCDMEFGIASVAAITVICYLAGVIAKATTLDNKWIPVICGVLGGVLGVAGLYLGLPDFPHHQHHGRHGNQNQRNAASKPGFFIACAKHKGGENQPDNRIRKTGNGPREGFCSEFKAWACIWQIRASVNPNSLAISTSFLSLK